MTALAGVVQHALEPTGFVPETRAFHPHLTLARFPQPKAIDVPVADVPTTPFDVTDVVLFRSQLHPQGARYSELHRVTLD